MTKKIGNDEIKSFRCPNGHALGQVIRNGSGRRQLLIYRLAVDLQADDLDDVDVMAIAEGVILDVTCSVCGRERTWVPGEETLRAIIKKVQNRREDYGPG